VSAVRQIEPIDRAVKRAGTGPIAPYEWRCDMSHVTANPTSTAKIVMNMTQRVHILPTITVTPFLIQSTSAAYLRATGKHGRLTVANYGRPWAWRQLPEGW
jgi:hypothetical protein